MDDRDREIEVVEHKLFSLSNELRLQLLSYQRLIQSTDDDYLRKSHQHVTMLLVKLHELMLELPDEGVAPKENEVEMAGRILKGCLSSAIGTNELRPAISSHATVAQQMSNQVDEIVTFIKELRL